MHIQYAKNIKVDYILYEYDDKFIQYKKWFNKNYPNITAYNIVNFYKIHLMYELAKTYDEILYLDFDVVPLNNMNFFDHWNLHKNGVAIMTNRKEIKKPREPHKVKNFIHSIRSPTAKYWNAYAMLNETNVIGDAAAYNTGIIGITKEQCKQLDYWGDFHGTLKLMDELKFNEDSMWPSHIRDFFGWDNETIWCYKMILNEVKKQELTEDWHHFMDKWNYIPSNTNLVHVINKNFEYVREWYEKNNL